MATAASSWREAWKATPQFLVMWSTSPKFPLPTSPKAFSTPRRSRVSATASYTLISPSPLSSGCAGRYLGGRPLCPQLLRAAEGHVRVELESLVGRGESEVGQSLREQLERDTGLQAGERSPKAEVDAVAERYVLVRVLAAYVERVRVLEDALVAVGRGEEEHQPRALGDLDPGDLHGPGGRAAPRDNRGIASQGLLDGVLDQGRVLPEFIPQSRLSEQLAEAVQDQVRRCLVAREREAVADAHNLVKAEVFLVLSPDPQQVASVVVAEILRPAADEILYIVEEGSHLLYGRQLLLRQRASPRDLQSVRAPAL